MDRILFLSHEASATGAPIFLLEFMKRARERLPNVEFDVVIIKDGVLAAEFESFGRTLKLYGFEDDKQKKLAFTEFVEKSDYSIAYFNTLECAHVLRWIRDFPKNSIFKRKIFHIHELEGVIQRYGGHDKIKIIDEDCDLIIAVSTAVCANLVSQHDFDAHKISVIPPLSKKIQKMNQVESLSFKKRLGINGRKFVLGCGDISACKGVDIFLNLAFLSQARLGEDAPFFGWVGPDVNREKAFYEKEISLKNQTANVQLFGFQGDVAPFFNSCDAFLMVSREDSHPLVCLEAASLGKPVVFYDEAGGIGSFFRNDSGFKAEYCDIEDTYSLMLKALECDPGDPRISIAFERLSSEYSTDKVTSDIFKKIWG